MRTAQLLCSTVPCFVSTASRRPLTTLADQAIARGQARLRHVAARKPCRHDRCWMFIMQGRGDLMRCTRIHSVFSYSNSTRQSCFPTTSNLTSVLSQSLDARFQPQAQYLELSQSACPPKLTAWTHSRDAVAGKQKQISSPPMHPRAAFHNLNPACITVTR
jgi:hypothetical protein